MDKVSQPHDHSEQSISELMRELNEHSVALLRDELALARMETREALAQSRVIAGWIGAAAAPAAVALVCVALGATAALANWMPVWAAAFLCAAVLGAVAAAFAATARRRLHALGNPLPRTTRTLREGGAWLKEEAS